MPRLGEFIGALLADAANARKRADIEAIKLATTYSEHELLRHLPVPRFRLPDITIDFPVVVSELQGDGNDRIVKEPTRDEIAAAIDRVVAELEIKAPDEALDEARRGAVKIVARFFADEPQLLLRTERLAKDVAQHVSRALKSVIDAQPDAKERFLRAGELTRAGVQRLLARKLEESPRLQVRVASNEIKAHGDNETLLRVRMTMSEDAYEIIRRDDEGRDFTIVPE